MFPRHEREGDVKIWGGFPCRSVALLKRGRRRRPRDRSGGEVNMMGKSGGSYLRKTSKASIPVVECKAEGEKDEIMGETSETLIRSSWI